MKRTIIKANDVKVLLERYSITNPLHTETILKIAGATEVVLPMPQEGYEMEIWTPMVPKAYKSYEICIVVQGRVRSSTIIVG